MESMMEGELAEVSRLAEVTSDAVAVCEADGTILHVNGQLLGLLSRPREDVVGCDIKDLLFSEDFERAMDHRLPFTVDGADNSCKLKLSDGSFVPVRVRACMPSPDPFGLGRSFPRRVLVAIKSLAEQYAHDRQTRRLLSELQAANRRLSGTLSVIMTAAGSQDLPSLLDAVLNKLVDTLDADGSTIYFSESGGFKLRGISYGLARDYVPEFLPYGAGVPTYVLREQRACRLSVVPVPYDQSADSGAFYDLDARVSHRLRMESMPPFKTLIAVPVYFGTQVLGIIECGWKRPCAPRTYDVRVLEVICDYLSIELVGLVSSVRSQRTEELTRSLNRLRELLYQSGPDAPSTWEDAFAEMKDEVCRMLGCHACSVLFDEGRGRYVVDFEGGSQVELPGSIDDVFFSATAPAARVDSSTSIPFVRSQGAWSCSPEDLKTVRLTRVDQTSWAGGWLASRGLPSQGVFFDLGEMGERGAAGHGDNPTAPGRRFLLLRDGSQEPIDDIEYDYLVRLAHDSEIAFEGMRKSSSERRIAQTLQAGMRSDLGSVPGITADSLYSSATKQALVGGDFYTLIRLPGDRAVMILGDVSGKGVEAASMSALVKTALTAYAWEGAGPQRMVRSLNSMLMSFSRVETFATMFVAKIDLRAGRATYCSAGHPPTMLIHPGEPGEPGEIEHLSVQSGVVGAFESMVYESGTFEFSPGDMLFMYTDGAIEARDARGEFFGEQRLRDVLLHCSVTGVEGLCGGVLAALDEFSDSSLDDDIALVALRFDVGREDTDDGQA